MFIESLSKILGLDIVIGDWYLAGSDKFAKG